MATARAHIRIDRPADEVWQAVTDPTLEVICGQLGLK